jgi:hypothetical protein
MWCRRSSGGRGGDGRRRSLQLLLKQSERAPGDLRCVQHAVHVHCATLDEMPHQSVGFVGGLAAVPMQRSAGVVLFVSDPRDTGQLQDGVGEVVDHAGCYRALLAFSCRKGIHVAPVSNRIHRELDPTLFLRREYRPRSATHRFSSSRAFNMRAIFAVEARQDDEQRLVTASVRIGVRVVRRVFDHSVPPAAVLHLIDSGLWPCASPRSPRHLM